jgi:hypothetical protein
MTPNDYIEKAKHALLTHQPNLAMLYMRRGLGVLEQRRRAYLQGSVEGQFILLSEDVTKMTQALVAVRPALKMAGDSFEALHRRLLEQAQAEYSL